MSVTAPKSGRAVRSSFQSGFALRPATDGARDLDDITRIHIEGFTEEPYTLYCYPLRNEHPEDHWKWTRQEYENYVKQPEKYIVYMLISANEAGNATIVKPAGVAVWNLAVLTKALDADPGLYVRKDVNLKHCEAFINTAGKRFTSTWFAEFAEKQINLSSLVVHPDFRRRGGGTLLMNWGIELSREKQWPTTLCASPMGRLLYEHLKFETVADEFVQCEGESESLESTAMILPY